jgi:hypothetical protein
MKHFLKNNAILHLYFFTASCADCTHDKTPETIAPTKVPVLAYPIYSPKSGDRVISRQKYVNQLQDLWLGEPIANWTGLVTEFDMIPTKKTGKKTATRFMSDTKKLVMTVMFTLRHLMQELTLRQVW